MTPTDKLRDLREEWKEFVLKTCEHHSPSECERDKVADWWLDTLLSECEKVKNDIGNEIIQHFGSFISIGAGEAGSIEALAKLTQELMRPKLDDDELRERELNRLEGLLPMMRGDFHDEGYSVGWDACLREVRERLFGNKATGKDGLIHVIHHL